MSFFFGFEFCYFYFLSRNVVSIRSNSLIDLVFFPPSRVSYYRTHCHRGVGGEDSYFIHKYALGVADGVGGWGEVGIDPSHFSRALTRGAEKAALVGERDALALMRAGYDAARGVRGSSTFCIVTLSDSNSSLVAANLGDSGFRLIRDSKIVFRSEEQQHSFNYPFQLATVDEGSSVDDAQYITLDVQHGDIVIVGSDGLFDNIYDEKLLELTLQSTTSLQHLAHLLAKLANENGMDPVSAIFHLN